MKPAEKLLVDLGIADPQDIDLPAIALCVGAEVHYRRLVDCEAQIIGFRERAVIYVDDRVTKPRRRFSTGHELGHWYHDRGSSFVCRSDDIGKPIDERSKNAERVADAYAGDLILPPFMITPRLATLGDITLEGIAALSHDFSTSLTATAIRVIRMTRQPCVLVAQDLGGRRWQWPSIVCGTLKVRDDIDLRSSAATSLAGANKIGPARKEPAHYWFDRRHIEQFDVRVQSVRTSEGEALTLLRILDERMIEIYG
ncbi:ImmA/IrrE family metallo-endopeptidase [Bradyrhizobium sp. 191]|uniref:ImmA/IrrE family metallo-endopeptidase n=1 Tax=Bradyrhizobium sp. 191 TaxID=2782659 RepID=UPI001FFE7D7B|nr:ImmA/IrrE family metallo-endopeptidase [Bradyrhizobium sp. 191]UPJ68589.1 ImmA/IrrE family metallo-endopeptidase [Bradyrhizobium sp. 191]